MSNPSQLLQSYNRQINEVFEIDPSEFGKLDVAGLNLLCAPNLPGSENLNIKRCLTRLKDLTAFVKAAADRNLYRMASDPEYSRSEPMWRMAMMVTNVKRDFGAAYSPTASADLLAGIESPITDSKEAFIHGLLDDDAKRRWGTCASIPVLMTAIARRLHYPIGLAVTRTHVYCRWEGREVFNIEASNPAGMAAPPDEHYLQLKGGLTAEEQKSGYFCRTLRPAEEFAVFLKQRVACLMDAARYDEALMWTARTLQFSPDEPNFPKSAYYVVDEALKLRSMRFHPERKLFPLDGPTLYTLPVAELLSPEERTHYFAIMGHYKESQGELNEARAHYENAARSNFHGNCEQRDLQRFLRKHRMPRRTGPLLPPEYWGELRRFKFNGPPQEQAEVLKRLADQFEHNGEHLKSRNALHDLYLFDPSNAEVFHRARNIERRPQFQSKLKTAIDERRQAKRKAEQFKFKLTSQPGRRI